MKPLRLAFGVEPAAGDVDSGGAIAKAAPLRGAQRQTPNFKRQTPKFFAAALFLAGLSAHAGRPIIYQLFVRHFGNTNETRKPNGTLAENGVGKFADIHDAALDSLRDLGITHVWLTGVLQQATRTDYTAIGQPADDPDICKGRAGSPYAIKDCFDVCPDYALDPVHRIDEFKALVQRIHAHGLKVLIDFVPNHVSRAYASDVRPDLSFGAQDDRTQFFAPDNHFFYLQSGSPPLRLPTTGQPDCDGLFDGEKAFGRVTGNNAATWTPKSGDWYETVKLNYGWNYLDGRPPRDFFKTVPRTWTFMDAVLAHWQSLGVDGFRCDMAHMIPMAFWKYAIDRARTRQSDALFLAEAYDSDAAKLTDANALDALLQSGFDAVYDDPSYDLLKEIYDGPKWAGDLDALIENTPRFHHSLRYAENHDEVRLANPKQWRGAGMSVGRPVSAILFALGRGPIMLYNGQEVGEPALGAEGYGGDDARTTLFDYWSLPELVKWKTGRLSAEQKALREFYAGLLHAMRDPIFENGETLPLTKLNEKNARFGRLPGESASGHWLCAFLRTSAADKSAALLIANLHPAETLGGIRVELPPGFAKSHPHLTEIPLGLPAADSVALEGDALAPLALPPLSVRLFRLVE